ncbi:RidA family protein [Piscinibacter sp. HJYY11]|uniref:RidA family protein n=1 Tax=Piscinibacter sp. HJYY11 TaxID=2801333 RepID=UPI00191EB069|nr:RidA family protein [Piscinibacter sp. HJYY11]MBL0728254.1 RidA family protein [Piscinibacter sp. HJYY11]
MNLIQLINPPALYDPVPNGYSHVAVAEGEALRLVLASGQGGEDREGRLLPTFREQLRQAIDNMLAALAAAGVAPGDVARTLVLVVDHTEEKLHMIGEEFDRVWGPALKPACTLVPVPRLALDGMLIEIEATAIQRQPVTA